MDPVLADVSLGLGQLLLYGAFGVLLLAGACLTCDGWPGDDTRDNDGDGE